MTIEAVFLDAGGTLLAERIPRARIYAQAARRRGRPVTDAEMSHWMYRVHRDLPRTLDGAFRYSAGWFAAYIERIFGQGLGFGPGEVRAIQDELFARFADPATFRTLPGALELLEDLRGAGRTLAVVSNWSEALPGLLAELGIAARVDFALVSALEGVEKPDPEIFHRALARAGVAASAAVHLGDRYDRDVAGAQAAGIQAVLLGSEPPEAAGPVDRVGTLGEFRSWMRARCESPPS